MNQRYRNDDDFGRRIDEDNTDRRYAQPSADARFDRDRSQRGQTSQNRRDDEEYFDNQRRGSSGSSGYGSPGGSFPRGSDWSERSQERPWQADRQRDENKFGRGFDSRFRGNSEQQDSGGFSSSGGYGQGERGFESNYARDYPQQQGYSQRGDNAFGGRQRFGGSYEAVGDSQWGERSFGGRGSYLDSSSQARRGAHFGKGPKGYQRSDERIREDVCDRLAQDDELDASDITVSVSDREVTLEGSVPDRYSKHRAEDIVDAVSSVTDIHNRLKVDKGFLQELGDKVMGREPTHSGNAGTRPTENKSPTENRNGLAAR